MCQEIFDDGGYHACCLESNISRGIRHSHSLHIGSVRRRRRHVSAMQQAQGGTEFVSHIVSVPIEIHTSS